VTADTFVCINDQPFGTLQPGQSVNYSGAAGTYTVTLVDTFWGAADCAAVFANPTLTYPVLSIGTFELIDDCTTDVQITGQAATNGTFIFYTAPAIIANNATPGVTGINALDPDPTSPTGLRENLCIDGNTFSSFNGFYPLAPGTYNVSFVNAPTFTCNGTTSPSTAVTVTTDTTTDIEISFDTINPNYAVTGVNVAPSTSASCPVSSSSSSSISSSSSMSSSSSLSQIANTISTIQDPLSCKTNLTGSGSYNPSANYYVGVKLSMTGKNEAPGTVFEFKSNQTNSPITLTKNPNGTFSFVLDLKKANIPAGNYLILSGVAEDALGGGYSPATWYSTDITQDGCATIKTLVRTGGKAEALSIKKKVVINKKADRLNGKASEEMKAIKSNPKFLAAKR